MLPYFASDDFLASLAATYGLERPRATWVTSHGRAFRMLLVRGRPLVETLYQPFYNVPLAPPEGARLRPIRFVPRVVHGVVPLEAFPLPPQLPRGVAPFVSWGPFPSFAAYLASRRQFPRTTAARLGRKLAREVGQVVVEHGPGDDATLRELFALKSPQFRALRIADVFARPETLRGYLEARRRGRLEVSTLRAGGQLLAGAATMRHDRHLYARLFAKDPQFDRYSPGTQLLHALLQRSYEAGDHEFDFLLGPELYKFVYATHVRVLEQLGRRHSRVGRQARQTSSFVRRLTRAFGRRARIGR